MTLYSRIWKSVAGKAVLATLALGGLLAVMPASASAAPVVVVRPGVHVVVRGGFYGPRAVYYGPRPVYYGPRHFGLRPVVVAHPRYWDARFHCWRYR